MVTCFSGFSEIFNFNILKMSVLDLNVNKSLLDFEFEGYKLSFDPIPVLKQPVINGVKCVELGKDDFSYAHTRMNALLNHLFQDPWSPNTVFYVNEKNCVLWTSLGQDERLLSSRSVWEINSEEGINGNVTLLFPGNDWVILCNGTSLYILYTSSRAAGEPWMCFYKEIIEKSNVWYLKHAMHRTTPGGQQIDCLLSSVVTRPLSGTSYFILQWISFSCGQNIQNWCIKRTRKLKSSSFPEYAAIDCDAIYVVSESDFNFFYDDSCGMVQNLREENEVPEDPKYTYVQTPEDITIYFLVPEGTQKSDIQVNFSPMQIQVLHRGKFLLDGHLGNSVDVTGCTWILESEKLEVHLSKTDIGLMWEELVKGNKEGKELVKDEHVQDHLTTDEQVILSDQVHFNLDQLEECDSPNELTFQRIDGSDHQETHRINLSGHQWIFLKQVDPEQLPIMCIRYDVDGLLLQPKNTFNEKENFKIEHLAVLSALGYVQASKQNKKFISCSPDFSYSAISDCSRHVYLYCQPETNTKLELRNRKTGKSIAHIAKQFVLSLEDADKIMGMQLSAQCIFILSTKMIYAAKIKSVQNN